MTKRPERIAVSAVKRLGLVTLLASLLVALVGLLTPPASASPLLHPETRVAAIAQPNSQLVGPSATVAAVQGRERAPSYDSCATGSSVAAEGGAAAINTGDVSVYTSTNPAGDVDYVGITNNLARRAAEQLAGKGIDIEAIDGLSGNLSRADARAVEQVLIEEYGGSGGGQLINKINSISPNNPIYQQSIQRGCAILASVGYSAPNVCG
jgi:hypothetical protein